MLDKSVPFSLVHMRCVQGDIVFPPGELPKNFRVRRYRPGDRERFAALELAVGEFAEREEANAYFDREFAPYPDMLRERCFLLEDGGGEAVGIAFAWRDSVCGAPYGRIRRVAVRPDMQGKGLAKPLIAALMRTFQQLDPGDVFVTTQTWSWRAVRLYSRFGFRPDYPRGDAESETAWAIIREKLGPSWGMYNTD